MKKFRGLVFALVLIAFLTPSVVLIVQASSVGDFPEKGEITEITVTLPSGETKLFKPENRMFSLLFELFPIAEKVSRRSLPEEKDLVSFGLMFHSERKTEQLWLYFSAKDYSAYIRTSEKKLYALPVPTYTIGSVVLSPTKMELYSLSSAGNEAIFQFDPSYYAEGDELAVVSNTLSDLRILSNAVFSAPAAKQEVRYFEVIRDASGNVHRDLLAVSDEFSIAEMPENTAIVCIDFTVQITEDLVLVMSYWFQ